MRHRDLSMHTLLRSHHLAQQRKFDAIMQANREYDASQAERNHTSGHGSEDDEALRAVKQLIAKLSRGAR